MNSRYKFRICHESNGHKTIIYPPTNTFMIGLDGKVYENYKKRNDHGAIDNLWEEVFDADNVIIQQYTGLEDSTEKEIYEGDILKVPFDVGGDVIGQVLYEADHGGYIFQWERKGPNQNYEQLNCDVAFESVIIGNIFENPELLK